jgi:hypothetical protein
LGLHVGSNQGKGFTITSVDVGSLGSASGLKVGDIITSANGDSVAELKHRQDFTKLLSSLGSDTDITFTYLPLQHSTVVAPPHDILMIDTAASESMEDTARALFFEFDQDGSGNIDRQELVKLVCKCFAAGPGGDRTEEEVAEDAKEYVDATFVNSLPGRGGLDFDQFVVVYNHAVQHFGAPAVEGDLQPESVSNLKAENSMLKDQVDASKAVAETQAQEVAQLRTHCEKLVADIQTQSVQLQHLIANSPARRKESGVVRL